MIREFETIGVIMPVVGLRARYLHYHRMCNTAMDDALTYSRDKVAATNMISVMDKEEDPSYDQIQLPTDIIWPEVIKKDPTISENELVNMIMKEVDNMDANYFDKDINPALSAIEELENRVIDNPIDEPNSTLKVCSNQSDVESRTGHKLVESYLSDIMLNEYLIYAICKMR